MQLTRNFHLSEFTRSQTASRKGIDNTPTQEHINNLQILCERVLQPIRDSWDRPITISSGYRSPALNKAVGGSRNSQHANGMAADFEIIGVDNCELANWIINNLEFDQLILEFHNHNVGPNDGWVHVSFNSAGNRRSILSAKRQNGRTKFLKGIVP